MSRPGLIIINNSNTLFPASTITVQEFMIRLRYIKSLPVEVRMRCRVRVTACVVVRLSVSTIVSVPHTR